MADALRKDHVRVPIAGVSHWRREPEFSAAQAASGLDLIDDRLFWTPLAWVVSRETLAALEPPDVGLAALAAIKRRPDRPYVLGQWCNQTQGAWSFPHEAADQLLGVYTALDGDWDALVRRGIFIFPLTWGEGPAGTVGGEESSRSPRSSTAAPTSTGSGRTRRRCSSAAQVQPEHDRPQPPARAAGKDDEPVGLAAGTPHVADC